MKGEIVASKINHILSILYISGSNKNQAPPTPTSNPLRIISSSKNAEELHAFPCVMDDASLVTPDQPGAADEIGGMIKRKRITEVIRAVFIETSLVKFSTMIFTTDKISDCHFIGVHLCLYLICALLQARRIRNRKLRRQPSQWEIREPSESSVEGSVDLNPNSPEAETAEQQLSDSEFKTICLLNERDSGGKKSVKFTACFLPLSLLVLVLWGKVCAILFTSTLMLGMGTMSKDSESCHGGRGLHLKHYLRGPLFDL